MVILHGFASGRANHRDYAALLAESGLNALAIDLRGHGESDGSPDGGMIDDALAALDWLADAGVAHLGLRGSSLGGFLALHAATRHPQVRAVVAICPAHHEGLADRRGLAWAVDMPLLDCVARQDAIARGYWHAAGDELVPWQWSRELFMRSPHPRALRIAMGGTHTSQQHDPGVQAETIAFLRRFLGQ